MSKMSEEKYNGWTNEATWKVAVRCDYLRDVLFIKEYLEDLDIEDGVGLIKEVVNDFYRDVNWYELENTESLWTEEDD